MLKVKLFKILSLNFSFNTVSDFPTAKGRTRYSQKAARISMYLELISDSVGPPRVETTTGRSCIQ